MGVFCLHFTLFRLSAFLGVNHDNSQATDPEFDVQYCQNVNIISRPEIIRIHFLQPDWLESSQFVHWEEEAISKKCTVSSFPWKTPCFSGPFLHFANDFVPVGCFGSLVFLGQQPANRSIGRTYHFWPRQRLNFKEHLHKISPKKWIKMVQHLHFVLKFPLKIGCGTNFQTDNPYEYFAYQPQCSLVIKPAKKITFCLYETSILL